MNPPTYNGQPLSLLRRLASKDSPVPFAAWSPLQEYWNEDLANIDLLVTKGYQQVPERYSGKLLVYIHIMSQLCDVQFVGDGKPNPIKEQKWLWAHPEDIEYTKQAPVILGFALQDDMASSQTVRFPMLSFLPPPTLGELAIVEAQPGELHPYSIGNLEESAQTLWKDLGKGITSLAGGSRWVKFSSLTDEPVEIARWRIEELQKSFDNPHWEEQWKDVQRMAKQLATAYYEYHQSLPQNRLRPTIADIFIDGQAVVSSCLPFQAVISSIHNASSGAGRWENPKDQAPYFLYEKDRGNTIIEYKQGNKDEVFNDRTTASLWHQVQQFNDLDNDVLLAMIAHLIKCSEEDGSTWFFADKFLDYRGIKPRMQADTPGGIKRRAGHRQEDIVEVGRSVDRIGNIWITINQFIDEENTSNKRKRRKRREYTHKGRFLSIDEAWTQKELDTKDSGVEIGWKIRAGAWLKTFLESPNRQVALLCQKILEYDPYRQQWEKRLAYYFMVHGRMNTRARGGTTFNREVGKLLEELSLSLNERDPQRTRDRFEKALNQLVNDRQIDGWEYKEDVQLPARNWLTTWCNQMITIHIAPAKSLLTGQE